MSPVFHTMLGVHPLGLVSQADVGWRMAGHTLGLVGQVVVWTMSKFDGDNFNSNAQMVSMRPIKINTRERTYRFEE